MKSKIHPRLYEELEKGVRRIPIMVVFDDASKAFEWRCVDLSEVEVRTLFDNTSGIVRGYFLLSAESLQRLEDNDSYTHVEIDDLVTMQ
jgi:hypothetical protein